MDKNEIAALLESLCERPFAGGRDGEPPAVPAFPGHAARALADAEGGSESPEPENPGRTTAALASILSGTATDAQCHGFQEAAMASGAVRLEAQSALAFVDGIEQAPLKTPAHLVEQVLVSAGSAPSARPGIWSRLAHGRLGGRRGQVAAACAVMLMAGGVSWSLLRRPADFADQAPVPMATSPKEEAPISVIEPKPAPMPMVMPTPAAVPGPAASPAPMVSPLSAPPPLAVSPVPLPVPAPPAQALADPCVPRGFQTSEAGTRSKVESKAAKSVPGQQTRTAAVSAPDPGCAVNGGTFEADQGPVRAAPPAAKIDRSDPAAAAASAPAAAGSPAAARPASPAKRPSPVEQRR